MNRIPTIASRVREIAQSARPEIQKGKDASEGHKNSSKGHEAIRGLWKLLYPHNKLEQNNRIELTVNGRKRSLEFDIVDMTMKIVVEVQGAQHLKYSSHFHNGDQRNFIRQQQRDNEKRAWCFQNGWTLLEITDKEALRLNGMPRTTALPELASLVLNAISDNDDCTVEDE